MKKEISKNFEPAILRLSDVAKIVNVSTATWLRGVKSGIYPKPIKLGARAVGWKAQEIREFCEKGIVEIG